MTKNAITVFENLYPTDNWLFSACVIVNKRLISLCIVDNKAVDGVNIVK